MVSHNGIHVIIVDSPPVRDLHFHSHIYPPFFSSSLITSPMLDTLVTEAYWVLFRFLYGGQLADPSLIIHIDDVGWSAVSERFV